MTTITPTEDPTLPRRFADFDTVVEALDYAARGQRGANFFNGRGDVTESVTWSEIRDAAEEMGRKLITHGFQPGDRIALIAETSPDFVKFFMGCQYASVLPVPLPLPTSFGGKDGYVGQLRGQLESCMANGLMAPAFMAEMVQEAIAGLDMRFFGTWEEFGSVKPATQGRTPLNTDLAYLQYSSGSTRFPHGVAVTHRSLLSNTHGMTKYGVQMNDQDRTVSWLPFYHDMGLVGTLLAISTVQGSVDLIPTEEFARRPLSWLRVVTQTKGTLTYSPTFGYDICTRRATLRANALDELDLSSIRAAGIGGDMIRPEVLRAFAEAFARTGFEEKAFLPSYGLAECTLGVSFNPVGKGVQIEEVEESLLSGDSHSVFSAAANNNDSGEKRTREVVNCGKPLPEFDIEIRDDEDEALAEQKVGKVYVRGESVMREYFNDPETTRAVLSPEGWLDTGDMGYMHEGSLFIVGRAKDMIIVNGRNHWPQDIEWAAETYEGVKTGDVAAISIPGAAAEEIPTILVQCRITDPDEQTKFITDMRNHVQRETGVSCDVKLVRPRALPRTSSGKLSRAKARTKYLAGDLPAMAG